MPVTTSSEDLVRIVNIAGEVTKPDSESFRGTMDRDSVVSIGLLVILIFFLIQTALLYG